LIVALHNNAKRKAFLRGLLCGSYGALTTYRDWYDHSGKQNCRTHRQQHQLVRSYRFNLAILFWPIIYVCHLPTRKTSNL
jgi:hypothetical protein